MFSLKKCIDLPESSTENSSHEEAWQSIQVTNRLHHEVRQQLVIISDATGQIWIAVVVSGVNQQAGVAANGYDADDSNSENSNSAENAIYFSIKILKINFGHFHIILIVQIIFGYVL